MLKKAFAVLTLATVALLAIPPSAAMAAGPAPALGGAPLVERGHGDGQDNNHQGQNDNNQGQNDNDQGQNNNDQGQDERAGHPGGYVPSRSIIITGLPIPGGTIIIVFGPGSFRPGEHVTIVVGGRTVGQSSGQRVTLGALKAAAPALEKAASADGSLKVTMTLPEGATGTQTVTATGAESGSVGTAATTVVPRDVAANPAPASLVSTGPTIPLLLMWAGAAALLLAALTGGMLAFIRRRRTP